MTELIHFLKEITTFSDFEQSEFFRVVKFKSIDKGELLLECGSTPRFLYFIKSGVFRGYVNQNGKFITTWFAEENEVFTSFSSFISQKPSLESIECLSEGAELYYISYENLYNLYERFHSFNTLGRKITENHLVKIEERAFQFQYYSAKQRYEILFQNQPKLFQRVNLGLIASYLGITQETLSRIRGI